jgi:hypothetical protein
MTLLLKDASGQTTVRGVVLFRTGQNDGGRELLPARSIHSVSAAYFRASVTTVV